MTWAVNTDVTKPLTFVATDGFFYVFVGGGKVVVYAYSFDKKGVGCLWGGKGDF
jgi:hypothetical protein